MGDFTSEKEQKLLESEAEVSNTEVPKFAMTANRFASYLP